MDQQLVSQVSQRAGLSPDQATQAIQAVAEFLKGRLPGPIAMRLDSVIGGQAGAAGLGGQVGGQIGGMGNPIGGQGNLGNMPNQIEQIDQQHGGAWGDQTHQQQGGMFGNQP